ncbi:DNA internalization-related competence protein ComEC/Rec2 [Liquorilactobacillus mali]|uniref:ComE operon protein 3 n=1 Tax=Liquorilactobacillus mali TaxID=1618 RepID=A0A0R2G0R0_9LACO|nr:DNA internalization-related competence protein ComEC/Rec2 [Liquorilactobacillus mali]KRN34355.1 ComE operon protein 3 [Liquorilactobacillus mali]
MKFSFNWIALAILAVLLLRVVALRSTPFFVAWFLFVSVTLCVFIAWQRRMDARSVINETKITEQHVILYPDDLQINGDLLKFSAFWIEGKQKIQSFYIFKSENERKLFLDYNETAIFSFRGTVKQPDGPTNENQFDYQKFLKTKNIVNTVNISELNEEKDDRSELSGAPAALAHVHNFRKYLLNYLGQTAQPLGGYSQLLLLGYYDSDFSDPIEIINKLGLLYLFSLSGMHVFYIISVLRWFFAKIYLSDEFCSWFLLIILPLYTILGGLSASLLRSVMMSWLILFSQIFFKKTISGVTVESLVLIINLYWCPMIVFAMGAQLSYLLTFVLIMNRRISPIRLGLKLTAYSIPIVLWNTYQWNWLTTILSVAIVPFFEWLVMPAVVIGAMVPVLGALCNEVLIVFTKVLFLFGSWPLTWDYGKPPLFFVVFWIILLFLLEQRNHSAKVLICLCTSFIFCALMIRFPLQDQVIYFDIGQGDSTLIRERFNGCITLVDTGGKVTFNNEEWKKRTFKTTGETIIANYLLSKGISKINNLFLTHQDTDHVGNFPSITQKIRVDHLFVPDGMEVLDSFRTRLAESTIETNKIYPISTAKSGKIGIFKILHPFTRGEGTNEDSITLNFKLRNTTFIISGDLAQDGEKEVINLFKTTQADILKTGHHGSKTSTSKEYVDKLKPKFAIISAGRNNRYGHPNIETIKTLNEFKVPYVNTASVGMVKIVPQGQHSAKVETFLKGNGEIR